MDAAVLVWEGTCVLVMVIIFALCMRGIKKQGDGESDN